jgi:acetyl-CoA C-acetyltransferase
VSRVSIIGTHNTPFGAFVERDAETGSIRDTRSLYDLIIEAGRGAIASAGLEPREIDAVWVGSCSPALFANQEHVAPLALEIDPEGLRYKPMTRTECACASSTVALYDALYAIEAGRYGRVLVIGVEKMNLLDTASMTHALACSSYWPEEGALGTTFPGLFAEYAKGYRNHYGIPDDVFAQMRATVSALAYRNGAENPIAHFGAGGLAARRGLFTADAILDLPVDGRGANVMVAEPLRLHDCSLVTDGAAALVLAPTADALSISERVVEIAGIGHAEERMPMSVKPNLHELVGASRAARQAFDEAGISAQDLDLAEVHDCFSIAQLLCTEALGLSEAGRSGYDYLDGRFTREDRTPVNLSGGLKAKGHPVGATGASMHVHVARQLLGEPIGVVHPGSPTVGAVLNVGGSGVTNCVSVLRRIK